MSDFYNGKFVVVCGGGGFLGSQAVYELLNAGAKVRVVQRSTPEYRLGAVLDQVEFIPADLTSPVDCATALKGADIVVNAAAQVGGIQFNMDQPGLLFYSNASMGLHLLEAARVEGVERFVLTSSTCVYPREAPVPTTEDYGLVDEPERSNIGYGWAKRVEELAVRFYVEQYGMKVSVVRPTNLYGPWDHFDPAISHVIPALIRRTLESDGVLEVWGSGTQTRSFLHVKDAAKGLLAAGAQLVTGDPINIGTDEEVTVRQLVEIIIAATGRDVEPRFDTTKPEGQPRKAANLDKYKQMLDWRPEYSLEMGLRETVDWYMASLRSEGTAGSSVGR